jgi:hypothetical protein
VRWRTRKARVPWSGSAAWRSADVTGTKRMVGRVVLRLPSIHRIDGSLRERLQTLADRRGIGRIGLAALHIGLDAGRRHDPHLVAGLEEPTRPAMR